VAVIPSLIIGLALGTGLRGSTLWFGLRLLFLLLGEVILLFSHESMFLAGLIVFRLTHICYLIGFRQQILAPTAWSLVLITVLLLNAVRRLRRIAGSMRARWRTAWSIPLSSMAWSSR
jgi:uncharacterized membrane protein YhhN